MPTDSNINFKISGCALSFLYYECNKSRQDQVGFLIGEKYSYTMKTISDNEMNGERSETLINITSALPIGLPFVFCNNVGRIDHKKLKEYLGPFEKDICGWYIFRRNSKLGPLLRGTLLHRELLSALPHISPQSFVLCCLGSEVSSSLSTHRHRHVFLLYKNRCFEPISVPVTNLGQPSDTGYKTVSLGNATNSSFNNILSSLNLGNNVRGAAVLKSLQRPLQEKLLQLAKEVQQSDLKAQHLVDEIDALKATIFNSASSEPFEGDAGDERCDRIVCENSEELDEQQNHDDGDTGEKDNSVGDKLTNSISKSLSDEDSPNSKFHLIDSPSDRHASDEY